MRRAIALFEELTEGVDLSGYDHLLADPDIERESGLFADLYEQLEDHGFELLPYGEAGRRAAIIRNRFSRQLEFLIDGLLCPRGFWAPDLALELEESPRVGSSE